jgi:hypothetical protein
VVRRRVHDEVEAGASLAAGHLGLQSDFAAPAMIDFDPEIFKRYAQ